MSNLFLNIVNMSINASWLICAVIFLRLCLKKAPKWVHVLLWGLVAVRLLCPFSIESAWSFLPSSQVIPENVMMASQPMIQSEISTLDVSINQMLEQSFTPNPADSANPLQIWISMLTIVWLVGMVLLLVYAVVSYWKLNRKVCTAVLLKENIFQSEFVHSPFVLGLIRPKIYLPLAIDSKNLTYVVAHEQAHIQRKDYWWKPLGFMLLAIHWFNPLVWLAYVMLCRDIELACDEKVIQLWNADERANYSQALLSCSIYQNRISACPLAFGEVGVKERVKSVLHYKKPAFCLIALSVVLCILVGMGFLTDPVQAGEAQLTREDVILLSKQGEALTWSDFEGYSFTEIGSRLCIRKYPIDEMFYLEIGGGSLEEKPMYISLISNDGIDQEIDIRYYSAQEYIKQHKDNPVVNIPLEEAISDAILEHTKQYESDTDGIIHTESHIILVNEIKKDASRENAVEEGTVYLVFFEGTYNLNDFKQIGGSTGAIALDFCMNRFRGYTLKEYWEPRDGNDYETDIREKFPPAAAEKALTATYHEKLKAQCEQKVHEMLGSMKSE